MKADRERLAERLRGARLARGLTQAEVARMLGLRRPAISEIESGRRSVASEELYRLSRVYGKPLSELLAETPADIDTSIARMTRVIVDRFDPERIILFGSHGRGNAGPDSDVDLLIVMHVRGSRRQKAAQIGAAVHHIRLPKDIIVTTPTEFEWRQHVIGTIERPAAREGRVLYARR